MPVLEDGLSSGHASDTENNVSVVCYQQPQTQSQQAQQQQVIVEHNGNSDGERLQNEYSNSPELGTLNTATAELQPSDFVALMPTSSPPPLPESPTATPSPQHCEEPEAEAEVAMTADSVADNNSPAATHYGPVYAAAASSSSATAAVAAAAASAVAAAATAATSPVEIQEAMKEIRSAIQRAKAQPDKLKFCDEVLPADPDSPVWVPRKTATATAARVDEEEADTDLETDRLLGQQDFFGEQVSSVREYTP